MSPHEDYPRYRLMGPKYFGKEGFPISDPVASDSGRLGIWRERVGRTWPNRWIEVQARPRGHWHREEARAWESE